jgi:hypothetical protein
MSNKSQIKVADDLGEINARANDRKPDSRRELIRAGIVAVPVLLTLRGKPALAQTASAGSSTSG